ncbi:hypothetical protein [Pseudonocardia charpentierae]|uniref:Uncharacterized protein n=1 Tax=Pseudonocardia charpentierae TaxID=3075545 RepID=A0ABU2NGW5_9PSEU|nr:hypothetical protein [Pseudonocardia sp. DSM 45834]MDT0353134.1 hypothetical protein [Pseudonocardia sp. DSM 45834]
MPATPVLTAASTLTCGHPGPGKITITPASTRLTVGGVGVLTAAGVATIAGCAQPSAASPPTAPCPPPVAVSGGSASRLFVDGVPVLLASTFAAATTGVPPAVRPMPVSPPVPPPVPIDVDAGQTRLQAE